MNDYKKRGNSNADFLDRIENRRSKKQPSLNCASCVLKRPNRSSKPVRVSPPVVVPDDYRNREAIKMKNKTDTIMFRESLLNEKLQRFF